MCLRRTLTMKKKEEKNDNKGDYCENGYIYSYYLRKNKSITLTNNHRNTMLVDFYFFRENFTQLSQLISLRCYRYRKKKWMMEDQIIEFVDRNRMIIFSRTPLTYFQMKFKPLHINPHWPSRVAALHIGQMTVNDIRRVIKCNSFLSMSYSLVEKHKITNFSWKKKDELTIMNEVFRTLLI